MSGLSRMTKVNVNQLPEIDSQIRMRLSEAQVHPQPSSKNYNNSNFQLPQVTQVNHMTMGSPVGDARGGMMDTNPFLSNSSVENPVLQSHDYNPTRVNLNIRQPVNKYVMSDNENSQTLKFYK